MPPQIARLTDIIEAVELIRSEMAGLTLQAFEPDKRKRWLVERGVEIISEASRHLSDELKGRHPEITWSKVAGIGNVLRHEYERVAYDVLWRLVRDDYRRWRTCAARSWRGNKPPGGERIHLIGICEGVILHVTYTERGDLTWIISARRATRHEQDDYYRENAR